jgi:PAS domain S-box-containing protein
MRSLTPAKYKSVRLSLLITGFLFLFLYLSWLIRGRADPYERFFASGLAQIFTSLAAIILAAFISFPAREIKKSDPREIKIRLSWRWILVGLAVWVISEIIHMALGIWKPDISTKYAALGLLYAFGSLPLWIGLLKFPRDPRQIFSRLGLLSDTTISTIAVLTLMWMAAIQPILNLGDSDAWMAIFYPMADLGLLMLVINLFLFSDTLSLPPSLGWLILAFCAITLSDFSYAGLLQTGHYQVGTMSDAGWIIGDLLIALAALIQIDPLENETQNSTRPRSAFNKFLTRLQTLLPVISVLVMALYAIIIWQVTGVFNQLGLWVAVILGLGLATRQGMQAGEIELQQYTSLVNSVTVPAFICDRRGRLRLINPALLNAIGFTQMTDVLGRPLQSLIAADDIEQIITQGLDRGWSGEEELRRLKRNNQDVEELVPVLLSLQPLQPTLSTRLALAGTAYDLSDQKRQTAALQLAYQQIASDRAELELLNSQLEQMVEEKTANLTEAYEQLEEQNRSLQELDRLKSDFVSMVSHELRAPLTTISGGIELILANREPLPNRVCQNLKLVRSEILRLTRFVETILDFSALEAGRLPLYPAPLDLPTLMNTLQGQMVSQIGAVRLRWQVPIEIPPIMADQQALTSVFFHLLDNAFKYAPEGEITVSAGVNGSRAWIRVADEGPGIAEDQLPRLFDRFYRLSSDAQTVYGHGLGLYIVARLIEAMGGSIIAENQAKKPGAVFTCWLPLVSSEEIS